MLSFYYLTDIGKRVSWCTLCEYVYTYRLNNYKTDSPERRAFLMEKNIIYNENCLEGLRSLPDKSVHCCVTSPPYWGLRDYGVDDQLGLEPTPEEYIDKIVQIFEEVRRVLRDDGTLWINVGDSYASSGKKRDISQAQRKSTVEGTAHTQNLIQQNKVVGGLKTKDLVGIPWMIAFALRNSGWYLRQDIIWSKPNPMPESVTDRCTKSHEYIFLLSKLNKYYYDHEAIKTPVKDSTIHRMLQDIENQKGSDRVPGKPNGTMKAVVPKRNPRPSDNKKGNQGVGGIPIGSHGTNLKNHSGAFKENGELIHNSEANKRSVWTVTVKGYKEAHFATYPEKLIVDCIKAGTSEFGCCSKCKAPYERIVESLLVPTSKASYNSEVDERDIIADKLDQGSNRMKDGHKPGWAYKTKTLDWQAGCDCEEPVEPCVVLDPFMGAGTTALVARKLNRDYVGFELSTEYIEIAERRLEKELGFFI